MASRDRSGAVLRTARLRALAAVLTAAEQRERRRLAGLLHDHLQQLLMIAKCRLDGCRRLKGEKLRLAISEVEGLILDCIEASRTLTAELSPPALHNDGLVPALEWLVRWMRQKHQLVVELHADAHVGNVKQEMRILLFEAVRELLFNVVKHSGVRSAKVEIARRNGALHVIVSDEGAGFEPAGISDRATSPGYGLSSIRERLELLGGRMEIESAPGKGASFRLIVTDRQL